MVDDKKKIQDLIETWSRATTAGNIETILPLMDEDAIFLQAGQEPMRGRAAFAAQFQEAIKHVRIEVGGDIQEIEVSADMAYVWNLLTVTVTPIKGGPSMKSKGPALTIFRKKQDGQWVLRRDANLLVEELD
jgi:uncharacterized protein (TIGR02246 family)